MMIATLGEGVGGGVDEGGGGVEVGVNVGVGQLFALGCSVYCALVSKNQ